MASGGKKKMTMAKRDRENRLRLRRVEKHARKAARKLASQSPDTPPETDVAGGSTDGPPLLDDVPEHPPDG